MKKLLCSALVLVLTSVFFAGCGDLFLGDKKGKKDLDRELYLAVSSVKRIKEAPIELLKRKDSKGYPAIMIAMLYFSDNLAKVRELIKRGLDVNDAAIPNPNDPNVMIPPAHMALVFNLESIFSLLLENGTKLDSFTFGENSFLHCAAEGGGGFVFDYVSPDLIKHYANQLNSNGHSALHKAVIMSAGARLHARLHLYEKTFISRAVQSGLFDLELKNKEGLTAYEMAKHSFIEEDGKLEEELDDFSWCFLNDLKPF